MLTHLKTPRTIAGLFVFCAASLGITVWQLTVPNGQLQVNRFMAGLSFSHAVPVDQMARTAMSDQEEALLASDPFHTYFGIPIDGDTIGIVVDSDATMVAHIQQVAMLTHALGTSIEPGTKRFGVIQAVEESNGTEYEKALEAYGELGGATREVQQKLVGGRTSLSGALAKTEGWYADQVFLVLSKPINRAEIERLTMHAQQSGATTHVIALGEAARQDLSSISDATGGQFIPVSDDVLARLANRVQS